MDNSFRSPENKDPQARNAFWVSLLMAGLLTASLINTALTSGFSRTTWAPVVLIVIGLVSASLSRINRHQLGIWLLIVGMFGVALIQPFTSAGQGIVIGIAVAVVVYGIASATLSVNQVARVGIAAILIALAIILLDVFGPAGRPAPANPVSSTIVTLIFIVIFGVLLARQQNSPLAQFLSNVSIAWKMGIMVILLVLGFGGLALSAYTGLQSIQYQLSNMYDFMLVPIVAINNADVALANAQLHLENLDEVTVKEQADGIKAIQDSNAVVDEIIARYDTEWVTTVSPEFTQALRDAGELDLQQQELAALAEFHTAYDTYKAAAKKYLEGIRSGKLDKTLVTDTLADLQTARVQLQMLIAVNDQYADFSNTLAQTAVRQVTLNTVLVLVIGLTLSVVISYLIAISLTSRLGELSRGAVAMQAGQLEQSVAVSGRDELSLLGAAFNKMASQLQELIGTLEARVQARTKDLATVAEVGTATATILESKRLLQEVVDLTKERFNLYHSHIYLLDEKGENLVLTAGSPAPGRVMVAEGRSIPLDREQSLVARAAREQKGITVNDITQAPDFLPNVLLPDTRSELAVPMIVGGKVLGVFDVQSDVIGRFSDSDINIQTTLAAQVATSIQNVRQFEQSKAQADFESTVNTIGQKIQRATSVEDTLQTAIREISLALGATRVRVNIGAGQQANGNESNRN